MSIYQTNQKNTKKRAAETSERKRTAKKRLKRAPGTKEEGGATNEKAA